MDVEEALEGEARDALGRAILSLFPPKLRYDRQATPPKIAAVGMAAGDGKQFGSF